MLAKRLITAGLGIPLIFFVLLSKEIVLTTAISVCAVIALYEYYTVTGLKQNVALCTLGFISSILICLGDMFNIGYVVALVYAFALALFVISLAMHKKTSFNDIAMTAFGMVYIPYFISHIIFVRHLTHGNVYVWLIFIGAFMTDTFAYFTGKLLGRHKLCPEISPKKTIEGAVGGVIGCGLCFLFFGYLSQTFFSVSMDMTKIFVLGITCAVVSEVGDLTASIIKRQFNVKDFGRILPGHGGILDRIDSLLFVAPVVYLYLYNIGVTV